MTERADVLAGSRLNFRMAVRTFNLVLPVHNLVRGSFLDFALNCRLIDIDFYTHFFSPPSCPSILPQERGAYKEASMNKQSVAFILAIFAIILNIVHMFNNR